MDLLQNLNFVEGNNRKESGDSRKVLFSGFLVVFLGASVLQTDLARDLNLSEETTEQPVVSASACEIPNIEMITESVELADEKKKEKIVSQECQTEKELAKTLDQSTVFVLGQEGTTEIQAVTDARAEEKRLYEKRVVDLEEMLRGYPLQKMAGEIAKQDPEIAALIVGIARKESQWGVRSPKKNGDCFNYWGFKGAGGRGVGMGHACFATREEAVTKIANRLEKLVAKRGTSKPSALVTTWKCGSSCASHSKESVNKWVSDVNQYYSKVLAMK